jgi:hypothetical protein
MTTTTEAGKKGDLVARTGRNDFSVVCNASRPYMFVYPALASWRVELEAT